MTTLRITTQDQEWTPKYFGIIAGLFCALYMITMALNAKIFTFYDLVLPAGIIVFPLCSIITDLLAEIYGFKRTRQVILTVLACTILFVIFTQIAIHLTPASFWTGQAAFELVFSQSPRLALAGSLAWLAGEFSNTYIMSRLKTFQNAKHMPVRFIASTVVGQFLDTFVVAVVAFAGTMPWQSLVTLILSAWFFKVAYEIIALPISVPLTIKVKNMEGIEHFDQFKTSAIKERTK